MSAPSDPLAFPPPPVIRLLRLEGLAVLIAAVAAYAMTGGNWWLFAALLFAPDLAFLGSLAGSRVGSATYNFAHTYTVPIVLGGLGHLAGLGWALPVALIWVAHIGLDRVLGYGLKYPGSFHATHLGMIGKARKQGDGVAHAG